MVLPLANAFAHTTAVPYCSEAKNLLTTCSRDRLSFQARALAGWATQELSCAPPCPQVSESARLPIIRAAGYHSN